MTIKKATPHINANEGLIFEKSSPGKRGYKLPPLDVPAVSAAKALGSAARADLGNMPEVSEIEIIRRQTFGDAQCLPIALHRRARVAQARRHRISLHIAHF